MRWADSSDRNLISRRCCQFTPPRPKAGSTCWCCSRSSFASPTAWSINHWSGCLSSTGLVRGFLLAAEHPHRDALMGRERSLTPRAIRTAIDVIEAEAHLPLTMSSIAARSQVSVRSLQQGFKRHLGMSPMSYLREVRLRRAHQTLIESDPSTVTVASVASIGASLISAGSPPPTPRATSNRRQRRCAAPPVNPRSRANWP